MFEIIQVTLMRALQELKTYSNSNEPLLKKEYYGYRKKSLHKPNFSCTMNTFFCTWEEFLSLARQVFILENSV